jgi:hypothetical protein
VSAALVLLITAGVSIAAIARGVPVQAN